jgi:SecD/SecF fusion protein
MRTSPWVLAAYAAIILFGIVAAIPNLLTPRHLAALPDWLPKQQVTLGLDLRGGSHLVLEVDAGALKDGRLQSLRDDVESRLRAENIRASSIRRPGDVVVVTLPDPSERARALPLLRELLRASALHNSPPELRISKWKPTPTRF